MRSLERNKQKMYYANLTGKTELIDEYGNVTGQYAIQYTEPLLLRANVSPAKGERSTVQFGIELGYDKIVCVDRLPAGMTESSIMWIDSAEELEVSEATVPHDYIVKRIAKSINSTLIAVAKVQVDG